MAIISVSRRTDIPAFYGDWFIEKVKAGSCVVVQPFNRKKNLVSLKKESVEGFVFWSKNYIPFTEQLQWLTEQGYAFYLNYTVNHYPSLIEPLTVSPGAIINNAVDLSKKYALFWRYDPVYLSENTDKNFHIKNFTALCRCFENKVQRVIVNYIQDYQKVLKRIKNLAEFTYQSMEDAEKIDFTLQLKSIAEKHGIPLYSCTPLLYRNMAALQSHCVDKSLLEKISGQTIEAKISPTYAGCHCHKSTDIGQYNTCHHLCVYCYANSPLNRVKNIKA